MRDYKGGTGPDPENAQPDVLTMNLCQGRTADSLCAMGI